MSHSARTQSDGKVVRLPANRFYWSLLDSTPIENERGFRWSTSKRRALLGMLFEQTLPISIEEVHPVYHPLDGQRFLACGMARAELAHELSNGSAGTAALVPESLPDFIAVEAVAFDASRLNLRSDAFEPPEKKARRRRRQRQLAALALLAFACVIFGFERRTARAEQAASELAATRAALVHQILAGNAQTNSNVPAEVLLLAELRQLRQTRAAPVADPSQTNATPILAQVLAAWPQSIHIQTEALSITSSAITVRCAAPTSSDVQTLADALNAAAQKSGWQMQHPQVSATHDHVQAIVQFTRPARPVPPAPPASGAPPVLETQS